MSATVTITDLVSIGNRRMTLGTANLGTYTSGGIAVTAKDFAMGLLNQVNCESAGGYIFRYNPSTGKIMAYQSDDAVDPLDEVGSVDISTAVFGFQAIGF